MDLTRMGNLKQTIEEKIDWAATKKDLQQWENRFIRDQLNQGIFSPVNLVKCWEEVESLQLDLSNLTLWRAPRLNRSI